MRIGVAVACGVALLIAGCGGEETPRKDPFAAIERDFKPPDPGERAAPRWDVLREVRGTGAKSTTVTVDRDAIQWRARWQCEAGDLKIAVTPRPAGAATAGSTCPRNRAVTFIGAGERRLAVTATAPWRLVVEQQVDTPLHERPLAGMVPKRVVARGRFAGIERIGRGSATVYRLPSGGLALRLDRFVTEANSDLFVWLSRARSPRTTRQALAEPHRSLGLLKATVGNQNYRLPPETRVSDLRSIVVWCEPVRIAYAAAPLKVIRRR